MEYLGKHPGTSTQRIAAAGQLAVLSVCWVMYEQLLCAYHSQQM